MNKNFGIAPMLRQA